MMRIMLGVIQQQWGTHHKKYQKLSNKMLDLQNKHVGLYLAELWTHFVNYGGKKTEDITGLINKYGMYGMYGLLTSSARIWVV